MRIKRQPTKLQKKAKRGFRGYPIATVAFYGPDASRASKAVVGIVAEEDGEPIAMERWTSAGGDVRLDARIGEEILQFIRSHEAMSVILTDRIIGCPHEEGTDYPEGEVCPVCPYWADRDRWSGEKLSE